MDSIRRRQAWQRPARYEVLARGHPRRYANAVTIRTRAKRPFDRRRFDSQIERPVEPPVLCQPSVVHQFVTIGHVPNVPLSANRCHGHIQ